MTDSKREAIITNLVSALSSISVAAGDNSDVTVYDVYRRLFTIDQLGDVKLPMITVTSGDEEATIQAMGGVPKYRATWLVFIQGFVKSEDHDAIGTMVERLLRDVRKKIFVDMTRGSNCHTQRLTRVQTDEGILAYQGYGVFEIDLEIVYDYLADSP
jgi:hypothetical protein